MASKSKTSSTSPLPPSPQTKPATSLVSERLTRSEIDSLRQGKKWIADYAQKALKDKVILALESKTYNSREAAFTRVSILPFNSQR